MLPARRTHSEAVPRNRVRKIAPSLPCRKPCRAEQIPVAGAALAVGSFTMHLHGEPTPRHSLGIGFETLLRRFRVGSLVGRSKFPLRVPLLERQSQGCLFSFSQGWVSHFAKRSERAKNWRVTAILPHSLSCSLKLYFWESVSNKSD